ncbi:hypothetical protein SFRURICE_006737 [Spodoptera frugiperda]|nr:hypothetical protein SFRURICE_006737 [Spodoptera frugiperda]
MVSGVAVLSPTESGGCSGSDITEPRSPRSPESSCSATEESAGARMPPWACDPAPPAPRRLAVQPAPVRRSQPPIHRRITEYFNHKMKPQNGLKRDSVANDDTKKKCLPKNGVTHDLEKYISYLSQTLSPKVLMDVGKQNDASVRKPTNNTINGAVDASKMADLSKTTPNGTFNGISDLSRSNETKEKSHMNMNGFLEIRHGAETFPKGKQTGGLLKELIDGKRPGLEIKTTSDPSANGLLANKHHTDMSRRKVPIPASSELTSMRIAPTPTNQLPKKVNKQTDKSKMNGVVSSTTKLDSRMNGVTLGSNNLNLTPITKPAKKESPRKSTSTAKRTNRKSSACIANSKNLTWSKANNLKQQVQLQKQNCANITPNSPSKLMPGEASSAPKMNIPNGVHPASMINGTFTNLNTPVTNNYQNCHPINIPQPCNGTVNPNNLASFVAVPQNMMLTTLRIPQNGLAPQTLGQQNNMAAFNQPNVSSPTKLNSQFVFPLMQNINGTVVQIPNLMTKMPNFVLPQTPQLTTQRQDHLQNQQAASFLIKGTLLKLANTMTPTYPNVNKSEPVTSQPISVMNKNVTGMQTVGMTVQSKQNYTVNFSHPMLMPQPGFIVTSVPNINVKETWSYTNTNTVSSSQTTTYSSQLVHHPPPIVPNYTTPQALHTSSIPIAPVKPPDNPIQGTDPPSSTVKEHELIEMSSSPKCDVPWLSKTVNNNIFPLQPNKKNSRPFAQISSISEKLEELAAKKAKYDEKFELKDDKVEVTRTETNAELRKIEEVARREETIFTQITVLKDVSSDVHNTVIEANFCNTTTESESGIGTDKSIDSPSDSQTSKECDEDSSLSLSISVSSVEVQSQKSPILKQPKTLRFPPRSLTKPSSDSRTSSSDTTTTVTVCLWENCKREFDGDPDLLDHLQSAHVETQVGKEHYVCLWEQCKVRGKPSCSRLWLERHTLSHGGNKPFKCIVDGCERRFSTQTLLERHVNNHFNEATSGAGSGKKSAEGSVKLIRRNGKKLRYRRQPWSGTNPHITARMFDFFDSGMMEGLAWRLVRSTRWRLGGACPLREPPGRHTLTLRAALTATRYNAAADRREALVTYYPPNVLEDEWVPEKEVSSIKRVEIAELSASVKVALYEHFCASYRAASPAPPPAPAPRRSTPRRCGAARALSDLLSPRRAAPCRTEPPQCREPDRAPRPAGAAKRKMGRRYGGNSFWPAGR